MTIEQLGNELNSTGYKFRHFGWSKNPDGDFGVYAEDSGLGLDLDNVNGSEQLIEGTIDYFTRDDSSTPKDTIQNKLRELKISWNLNSVQYEYDSGYIHYEWVFRIYG